MTPVPRTPDIFLTLADAARVAGVSVRTLRRYIRDGTNYCSASALRRVEVALWPYVASIYIMLFI